MTAVPAAMPTPMSFCSCCSSASRTVAASITSATTIFIAPFSRFFFPQPHRGSLVISGVYRQLYINLREYSEYVGLDYRDEDLKRVEDYRHRHRQERHDAHGSEVQDQAQEDEDDEVPRQDVGVESHPQREWLGDELLQRLDKEHER